MFVCVCVCCSEVNGREWSEKKLKELTKGIDGEEETEYIEGKGRKGRGETEERRGEVAAEVDGREDMYSGGSEGVQVRNNGMETSRIRISRREKYRRKINLGLQEL